MIGLGGRANITSRGSAIGTFIKTGTTQARTIITINNFDGTESGPFKHDVYGDCIIVERHISSGKQTASSYVTKSSNKKVVERSKEEIDAIVAHFGMQIDNPVCILNQEVSRNFLNSKDPKDKYDFFMKATNLDEILLCYTQAVEDNERAHENLSKKTANLPLLQKDIKEHEKKLELFDRQGNMLEELNKFKAQFAWKTVHEKEEELKKQQEKARGATMKLENATKYKDKFVDEIKDFEAEKIELNDKAKSAVEKSKECFDKYKQAQAVLNSMKSDCISKQGNLKLSKTRIQNTNREIAGVQRTINEKQKENEEYTRLMKEKEQRLVRIDDIEREITSINDEGRAMTDLNRALKEELQPVQSKLDQMKADKRIIETSIKQAQYKIKSLEQNKSNKLAVYGPKIPELCRLIDEAKRRGQFEKAPYGPLGQYISLKDEDVGNAMQVCLDTLANSYVVQTNKDRQLMKSLMNRVFGRERQPLIYYSNFSGRRHDVRQYKVDHPQYKSMLDYLTISEDFVFNLIVDNSGLESIAYIPSDETATSLLIDANRVPRNCKQAYTRDCTVMYAAGSKPFRSYPNYVRRSCVFSRDVQQEIDEIKHHISKKQDELTSLMTEGRSINDESKSISVKIEKNMQQLTLLKNRRTVLQKEVEKLRSIPDPQIVEISAWTDEMETLKAKLEEQRESVNQCENEIATISARVKEQEKVCRKLDEERKRVEEEALPITSRKNDITRQIHDRQKKIEQLEEGLKAYKREVNENEKLIRKLTEDLEVCITKATAINPNKRECRSEKRSIELQRAIKRQEELIAEQQRNLGNREAIAASMKKLREKYDKINLNAESLKTLIGDLDASIADRKRVFKTCRKGMTDRVCEQFKNCLEMMDFDGELRVHHVAPKNHPDGNRLEKTLEVFVNPKAKSTDKVCKDTRSLSGGERSFSTVAFLMALWEHCTTPFRILDEVDVFMVSDIL